MIQRDKKLEAIIWIFVAILIWLMAILLPGAQAQAEESRFIEGVKGGYEWALVHVSGTDEWRLAVNTEKVLTVEREAVAAGKKDYEKKCTPIGKTLAGRLRAMDDKIAGVAIGYRSAVITAWPYPNGIWGKDEKDQKGALFAVLKVLDDVLGGKVK